MKRYPKQEAGADGWTDWVRPVVSGYNMECCDCGLVHTLQFRTADDGLPEFRARRNNRSTGQLRRYRSITVKVSEYICPLCRIERTDYEGPHAYLATCPNCGSASAPVRN